MLYIRSKSYGPSIFNNYCAADWTINIRPLEQWELLCTYVALLIQFRNKLNITYYSLYICPGATTLHFVINILHLLKHDYDVIHCSVRPLFSPNVQINVYRPKCSERIDFWTVSKDIGQLANTTQTVVFLQSSSVLFFK